MEHMFAEQIAFYKSKNAKILHDFTIRQCFFMKGLGIIEQP